MLIPLSCRFSKAVPAPVNKIRMISRICNGRAAWLQRGGDLPLKKNSTSFGIGKGTSLLCSGLYGPHSSHNWEIVRRGLILSSASAMLPCKAWPRISSVRRAPVRTIRSTTKTAVLGGTVLFPHQIYSITSSINRSPSAIATGPLTVMNRSVDTTAGFLQYLPPPFLKLHTV